MRVDKSETRSSDLCATFLEYSAVSANCLQAFSSYAKEAISLTAVKFSSTTPPILLEASILSKLTCLSFLPNKPMVKKSIGKKARDMKA
jgi:hypothetical protein